MWQDFNENKLLLGSSFALPVYQGQEGFCVIQQKEKICGVSLPSKYMKEKTILTESFEQLKKFDGMVVMLIQNNILGEKKLGAVCQSRM